MTGWVCRMGCLLALVSAAAGSSFRAGNVPEEAAWAVHVDMRELSRSPFGQLLSHRLYESSLGYQLDHFRDVTQFNPWEDLHGLTVFGISEREEDAVCLIHGRLDPDRLIRLVQARADYRLLEEEDGGPVHAWTESSYAGRQKVPLFGAFHGPDIMAVSSSRSEIHRALGVLRGQLPTWPDAQNARRNPGGAPPFLSAFVRNAALQAVPPRAAVLRNARELFFAVASQGDDLHGHVTLTAYDAQAAADLQEVLEGMKSIAILQSETDADRADLARRLLATREGADLHVALRLSMDEAREYLPATVLEAALEELPGYR